MAIPLTLPSQSLVQQVGSLLPVLLLDFNLTQPFTLTDTILIKFDAAFDTSSTTIQIPNLFQSMTVTKQDPSTFHLSNFQPFSSTPLSSPLPFLLRVFQLRLPPSTKPAPISLTLLRATLPYSESAPTLTPSPSPFLEPPTISFGPSSVSSVAEAEVRVVMARVMVSGGVRVGLPGEFGVGACEVRVAGQGLGTPACSVAGGVVYVGGFLTPQWQSPMPITITISGIKLPPVVKQTGQIVI